MRLPVAAVLLLLAFALAGCATQPRFDTADVRTGITPGEAVAGEPVLEGATVLWGGTVVAVRNAADVTRLEILSYPLGSDQRPNSRASAGARFLAEYPGFLDPAEYAPGTAVTVLGRISDWETLSVGDARRTLPVVGVDDIERWPEPRVDRSRPRTGFSFGLGIILN